MSAAEPSILRSAPVRAWPTRYTIIGLFFLSTIICYIDRVNVSVAIIPMARDRGYDAAAQGIVLSAFFWGYLLSQLVGGWMADRFGGKQVLAFGVATWSLATLLTPPAAANSFTALLMMRVLLGIGEGVNFPAIHSLAARWTTAAERSRALTLNYSGIHLGTVIALLFSPPLIIRFGWQWVFYLSGALGFIWLIAWQRHAADSPAASQAIKPWELRLLASDAGQVAKAHSVPWRKILREPAVWAIVLAHTCNNWGFYILLLWLPTYLNRSLHVPLAVVGAYSLIPWIATFGAGNAAGWVSDRMITRGVSRTVVRKLMQTLSFAMGGAALIALPAISSPALAVLIVTISSSTSALGLAAFGVNHLDVGPRYAGVLMGLSNTSATLPGIIGVAATGFILRATGSFAPIFYLTAAIYLIGLLGYLLWATGEQRL